MEELKETVLTDNSIVIDTETTGLDPEQDEIIQISIIAPDGKVLFDSRIRPERKKAWPEAVKIHGITPEMVRDAPTIESKAWEIAKIFHNADAIFGYNPSFDLAFLRKGGVWIPRNIEVVDVMRIFAEINGQ